MITEMNPIKISISRDVVTGIIKRSTLFVEQICVCLKEYNLTIQQFNVLRILKGRKGRPACLQDVNRDMIHSKSNTTRVIDKLIQKNLVERVQSTDDRRQIQLTITKKGCELLELINPRVDEVEQELTRNLTEYEMATIVQLLNKLEIKTD
ncbi:MAG: MarR family transcriptional regulator [Nonlabens sp.]